MAGYTVAFTVGTQSCSGVTNATGAATCTIAKLTEKPGTYTMNVSYAGSADYAASAANVTFKVGKA